MKRRKPGQAIIELALCITFVIMLMGATIDLGLAFKAYQTLINASAEASSYLDLFPSLSCNVPTCNPIDAADAEARERFRTEQGTMLRGITSTGDLDANGRNDADEHDASWFAWMIEIDEADNTQVVAGIDGSFGIETDFDPAATDAECAVRRAYPLSATNPDVTACYIVIRSKIVYRPFVLRPILGDAITIHAVSVRKVIAG